MELVLIAFIGTCVLMVSELRDFMRRHRSSPVTPAKPFDGVPPGYGAKHAIDVPGRAQSDEDVYDAAA